MKNVLKIFLLNIMLAITSTSANCLTKPEAQKLNEIAGLYYNLVLKSANNFLEQIKETKENDFICFRPTEGSLLAKEQLMMQILDSPLLLISNKEIVTKSILKRLKRFLDCSTENSDEKEARKLALFYAISSFENGFNSVVKDSNAEDYFKKKEEAKNNTIKFVPLCLVSGLVLYFSKDVDQEKNIYKIILKFYGALFGTVFMVASNFNLSTSWYSFISSFLSIYLGNKEKLESIKTRYKEQTNFDILNPPVIKSEFKKTTGQQYISDETLLRIFG